VILGRRLTRLLREGNPYARKELSERQRAIMEAIMAIPLRPAQDPPDHNGPDDGEPEQRRTARGEDGSG